MSFTLRGGSRIRPTPGRAARSIGLALGAVATAVGAAGLGALAVWQSVLAVGLAAVIVAIVLRVLVPPPGGPTGGRWGWIPVAWAVLFVVSNWKFTTGRSPLNAVSGSLSAENKIELIAYLAIAVLVAAELYLWPRSQRPIRIGALVAWPVFAVLSAAWSVIPIFTLARSLQLFVPVMLAVLMVRIWRQDPRIADVLWRRSFRLILQLITIAVAAGFVLHGQWPGGRFTWPTSPSVIVSSGMAGFGFVALLAGGRQLPAFGRVSYAARTLMFAVALAFGQTRSVLLGVVLASLVALWLGGRNRPAARYLTIPLYLGSLTLGLILAQSTLTAYVQRGQYGGLSTLNSRLPLWQLAIQGVANHGRWLVGSGFGSTRVILFPQVSFAGEAHNTWVEFLIELGVVGVILGAVAVVFLGYRLFRRQSRYPVTYRVGAALLVYLLVLSQADNYLANLGFAFTTMALLYALVLADDPRPERPSVPVGTVDDLAHESAVGWLART